MKAAEIMAVLNTIEEDHQLVLEKAQALKETVSCLLDPAEASARRVLERLRDIHAYFSTRYATHMEEEELGLFPFLQRHLAGGADLVDRLRLEHAEIRRKLDEFGGCLQVVFELEENPPRTVLRDLLAYGWELWELLDHHAHDETRGVHSCIDAALAREASVRSRKATVEK